MSAESPPERQLAGGRAPGGDLAQSTSAAAAAEAVRNSGVDPVLARTIKQVVDEITAPRGSRCPNPQAEDRFTRYLRDPGPCDVAYAACIDRINSAIAQGQDDRILSTVLVLRQYLTPYPPSVQVLHAVRLCVHECLSGSGTRHVLNRKALNNLAEAVRVHGSLLEDDDSVLWRRLTEQAQLQHCDPPAVAHSLTPAAVPRGEADGASSVVPTPQLHPAHRTPPTSRATEHAGREVQRHRGAARRSVQDCVVFGAHISRCRDVESPLELLPMWTPSLAGQQSARRGSGASSGVPFAELVARTGALRLAENGARPASVPLRPGRLPHFCYREERPVQLTQEQLSDMLARLAAVPGGMGPSHASVDHASKLLVNVLCDSYAAGLEHAAPEALRLTSLIALHVLRDLLGSPYICVRRLVLDVVFNLAVHANVVEAQRLFDSGRGPQQGDVGRICAEVLWLAHEILLQLVQQGEADETVWERALLLWLSVASQPDSAVPAREVLRDVDLRVLKRFLWLPSVACDERTRAALVTMMHDALLVPQSGAPGSSTGAPRINSPRVEHIGGWKSIVALYVSVHSWSARLCCFTLLFEHIAEQLLVLSELRFLVPERSGQAEHERQLLDAVRNELIRLDFPWFLPRLFNVYHENSIKVLLAWLERDGPLRDGAARSVLEKVLTQFQGLSLEWNKMPAPVKQDIKHILAKEADMEASMQQLTGLAAASGGDAVNTCAEGHAIAARWLYALMRYCADHPNPPSGSSTARLREHVERVLENLAADRSDGPPTTRLVFLDATEKYLLMLQEREREDGDVRTVIDQLWESMRPLVRAGESHPRVLLKMFHLTCDLLASVAADAPQTPLPATPQPFNPGDTAADMLLTGVLELRPGTALRGLCRLLAHILLSLSGEQSGCRGSAAWGSCSTPYLHSVRLTLLAAISACALQRDRGVVDDLGGLGLWQRRLDDSQPPVCLVAAQFLCSHLRQQHAQQWAAALGKLRDAGRDEEVSASPLLLARHVLHCMGDRQ